MVNVPPLLCSTPPPIDFGEDDEDSGLPSTLHLDEGDEYSSSEFGLVISSNNNNNTHEAELNVKDLSQATVEAFNYQVKSTHTDYNDAYHEPPPPLTDMEEENEEEDEEEEEEEVHTHENVPSLKLDSLSLYSSESVSDSPLAPPVLSHQVTLEDVTDDSDEECSPKKPKELYIPEGAKDFFAIEIVATPTEKHQTEVKDVDDDDDFGDFADFSAIPPVIVSQQEKPSNTPPPPPPAPTALPNCLDLEEDGFDDFQEFASPQEDDDDFGDFTEPTPAPVSNSTVPPPPPPAVVHLSLNERVQPVLELMFPSSNVSVSSNAALRPLAQFQKFSFGAIEQAQALDYQWGSSEMRHSLVRSLGIDSRNILFGEKWNPSMPRFAANLSFDPLTPLKPLSNVTASSSVPPTLEGLDATSTQTSSIEAGPGPSHGQKSSTPNSSSYEDGKLQIDQAATAAAIAASTGTIDATAATSAYAAPATAATLSPALSANGYAHHLNGSEQLHQQQHLQEPQFDLRASPSPPPPIAATPDEIISSSTTTTSYTLPLKETHIYTPSKSDTAVAKTTTLAPIDFDFEIASTGIIIDETVVKKEYRDVEYKPPFGLESPSKLANFELPMVKSMSGQAEKEEDDDFSDFQSVPAAKAAPRIGTPTFGEQMILSPAILLPQAIPLAKPAIQWGENALASINAEEMARIEELFSAQAKPPTISATVSKQPPQQQEDDEWSDFVSVPVQQQQPQSLNNNNNNNVNNLRKPPPTAKEDDWSDFVSSTPLPAAPAVAPAPQFNSGAWHSANFYNNPLSLYQQRHQPHNHSNLVRHNNNNSSSNNNNVPATPQQIHIMHDFSTAPSSQAPATATPTYQQQHQRQQFQIGNAKVAPRISLIPDLSFMAPALPTNAGAFMSSLPKPSFSAKK